AWLKGENEQCEPAQNAAFHASPIPAPYSRRCVTMRKVASYLRGRRRETYCFRHRPPAPLSGLLNVADLTVDEGNLQVLVHIDPFRTEIDDFLRLALYGAHLVDGEAEGERRRGAGIAALVDRLLFGTVRLLAGGGQFTGHVGVGLCRFLGVGGVV